MAQQSSPEVSHAATVAALAPAGVRVGESLTVRVPASTANLGPGFDSVGMGLGVWDEATARLTHDPAVTVEHSGLGADGVPRDASHLVVQAMQRTWRALGVEMPYGIQLQYVGAIPHSRGMGSSASAIVAGVALASVLAGHDLESPDVLAVINDVAAAMEGHPDNTSASVYGQATVSWHDGSAWRTCVLTPHVSVQPVVLVPDVRLDTAVARAALPTSVPLPVAAANSGRAALLTYALTQAPHLLMDATVDYLHQEPRRTAYPHSMTLVDALRSAGVPAAISGAGPTVLALPDEEALARVTSIAQEQELPVQVLTPGVASTGVHLVSS